MAPIIFHLLHSEHAREAPDRKTQLANKNRSGFELVSGRKIYSVIVKPQCNNNDRLGIKM